jgi:cytochrome c
MAFVRDAFITVLVIIVVIVAVGYAKVKDGGLSAEAEPTRIESSVARRLVRLSIPSDVKNMKNPAGADSWREAVDHFEDHCAVCHGNDGRGHTHIGENMYPRVPDLGSNTIQQMTDGEIFGVIQNGVRWTGMPAWKSEHSDDDTWKLVSFVRKVPTLTEADLPQAGADQDHHNQDHRDQDHRDHGDRDHQHPDHPDRPYGR